MDNRIYKLETCKSDVEFLNEEEINESINLFENAKAVVWYYDKIEFYNIESENWSSELKSFDEIVRMRLFDKEKELHLWRSNDILKGRLRKDTEGAETEYVTAKQILNGTSFEDRDIGIIAKEEKGTEYYLPFAKFKNISDKNKDRIAIITRNYIGYSDDIKQAGYIDSRFVDFEIVKNKKQ